MINSEVGIIVTLYRQQLILVKEIPGFVWLARLSHVLTHQYIHDTTVQHTHNKHCNNKAARIITKLGSIILVYSGPHLIAYHLKEYSG